MTEAEWMASDDPAAMLRGLKGIVVGPNTHQDATPSNRKLRLFACAACRQVWGLLTDDAPCGRCDGIGGFVGGATGDMCHHCDGTGRVNRSRRAVEVAERYADGEATFAELSKASHEAWQLTDGIRWVECKPEYLAWWAANPEADGIVRAYQNNQELQLITPAAQADLLREIVGNPWRPLPFRWEGRKEGPSLVRVTKGDGWEETVGVGWLTPTVSSLAQAAYEERRPARKCEGCEGEGGFAPSNPLAPDWVYCPDCHGTGTIDDGALDPARLAVLADALEELGVSNEIVAHLRSPGPHVRGCHVIDLLLGKS